MVKVNFQETGFEIDLEGIEKMEAFKSKLFVPYDHLTGVDDDANDIRIGLKLVGTSLGQNHYDYGRFETSEGYGFYAMKNKSNAFAIHLMNDKYSVIVLDVENKEDVIEQLRDHM